MKRMRFVSGLFIAVLLVIALALPMAVLAQESAAITEAETSAAETSAETTAPAEVETGPGEAEAEAPAEAEVETPGEAEVEDPAASDPSAPEVPAPSDPSDPEAPAPSDPSDPEAPAPSDPSDPEAPAPSDPSENPTIEGLISTVEGLNLQQGIENSLDAKLQNAKDSLAAANAGLREDAVNKLQAFINACEAQRDKALTSEQADELIAMANAIIASL